MTVRIPVFARTIERSSSIEFGAFLLSSSAFQASRLAVNLVAAALVVPAEFGVWSAIVTLFTYTTYANLGIASGANRRVPLLLGRGDDVEATRLEAAAVGGASVAGVAVAATISLVGAIAFPARLASIALVGAAIVAQQLFLTFQVLLRARLLFNAVSAQQALLAVTFPVVALPAVAIFGVPGLIASQGFAYGGGALLAARRRADVRAALDWPRVWRLVREGAPIMLSGLAFSALSSVDRWVVLQKGEELLGRYALAATISSSMMFISLLVAQQFYPRMALQVGAGVEGHDLFRLAMRQSAVAAGIAGPFAIVVIALAPLVLPMALPRYAASVGALQVLAAAYVVLAAATGFTNLLVATGAAWENLAIQVGVTALAAAIANVSLSSDLGLVGVAGAMLVSFFVFATVAGALAYKRTNA